MALSSGAQPKMDDTKSPALTVLWKIKQFSCCVLQPGYLLRSSSFVSESLNISNLILVLTPKTENDCIRIELKTVDDKKWEKVIVCWEYSLLTSDGSVLRKYKSEGFMNEVPPMVSEFVEREVIFGKEKASFLPGDTLTLRFKLWTNDANKQQNEYLVNTRISAYRRTFAWDLLKFNPSEVVNVIVECLRPLKIQIHRILVNSTDDFRIQINMRQNTTDNPNIVICQVIIQDLQGKIILTSRSYSSFKRQDYDKHRELSWMFPPFTIPSQWFTEKEFILRCEFCVSEGLYTNEMVDILPLSNNNATTKCKDVKNVVSQLNENTNELACASLKEGLQYLYGEKRICDVTLQVGTTAFCVHKTVLCAMSPVFTAMFERDMKESKDGVVNIVDIKEDTVKRMLSYLYCYDLKQDINWKEMLELYFAADKYEIDSLKKACTSYLVSSISNINACEILVLAETHQNKELRIKLQDFILENLDQILGTDSWESLELTHPHLTTKILRLVYTKR